MAKLSLQATVELIDKMTAPMRSIQSQASRLSGQFGDLTKESSKLAAQRKLIESFKQQRDALNTTGDALNEAESRLSKLSEQMQATEQPTKTLQKNFAAAQREAERLAGKFAAQHDHLSQLKSRMNDAGLSTENLANHERDLAQQIDRTNKKLADRRERMQKVRDIQRQADDMSSMRNQAAGLAAGGAAAGYAGARFIQPGIDLETNMSKVQAVTRLDKSSPQYQALLEQAKQLGASTQFTSADAAAGQTFLGMAGFTPEAIQAAMPGMLDLALAGGMELDRTADIASNILTGMKLDPTQMTQVADVLSAAFTRANIDVGMLGETMKYAAPGAAGLNISLSEVAAMAGKLGDAGIQGSMGGTALRSIMSRLASPPKAAAKALEELNIATTDASGNLRPMPDILQDLHDKTKNLGNAEMQGYFKDIGGEEAGGALQILAEQAGSGKLQELEKQLSGAEGEAQKLAQTMSDNTAGDFKAMQSAVDALRTSIYDANKDSIREFIQGITEMTQKFTTFANENPQLMSILGKVFGILALGAVLIGGLGAIMLTVLAPMAMLRASLVTLGLPTTLTPIGMLIKAVKMIGGAFRIVGMAMMSNPLLALLGLLAILAFTIYKNWDSLGPMFARLWQWICDGVGRMKDWIVQKWNSLVQAVINFANNLWSSLGLRFNSGIAALIAIIVAFTPVGLFIRVFAAVWAWFSGLGAKFAQYGRDIINGLKNGIMEKANSVLNGIKSIANKIKGAFTLGMDINSPSRVFHGYGGFMMQGLQQGIKANARLPIDAVNALSSGIQTQAPMGFDTRKSVLGSSGTAAASGGAGGGITINIYGATDPVAVGQEVRKQLDALQRNQAARHRSRLSDID